MINSNGRLFLKLNTPNTLNTFDFYNYANIPSIKYDSVDSKYLVAKGKNGYFLSGISINSTQDVEFTLKTYLFANKSLLKYIVDNNILVDFQLHYGKCSHPNSFLEYETVISVTNALLSNYSLNNILALTASENAPIEESVNVNSFNFNIFTKPKILSVNLIDSLPIIKMISVNNNLVGLTFESVDSGADNTLNLIYQTDDKRWNSFNITSLLGGNVNPYYFDIHYLNDKLYILSRDVAQNNYLHIVKLNFINDSDIVDLFDIDTHVQTIFLGLHLITTMQIVNNTIWFGTIAGNVLNFNIDTYQIETVNPKILQQINNSVKYNEYIYFACENGYVIRLNTNTKTYLYYKFETYDFDTVCVIDNILYLGINNKLYYSTDFKTLNEFVMNFNEIKDLKFYDKNVGYLCDQNRIYKTLDAGFSWEYIAIGYNLIGLELNNEDVIIYGTDEELGTRRLTTTLTNYEQKGNANLMV